jgi:hypothetical protein
MANVPFIELWALLVILGLGGIAKVGGQDPDFIKPKGTIVMVVVAAYVRLQYLFNLIFFHHFRKGVLLLVIIF